MLQRFAVRILLALAALGFLLAPSPAHATEAPSWSLRPTATPGDGQAARPYFTLSVAPGDEVADSATLYNPTQTALHLRLFSSDAYNTRRGGGFALHTSPLPNKDSGDWIKLPVSEFNVAPLTGVKIPFGVVVPKNAAPGDHVAGIVALDTVPSGIKQEGSATVEVKRAVGARVYIRVKGPVHPSLDIPTMSLDASTSLLAPASSGGTSSLSFTLANTGNTRQSPLVRVWLTDAFGRTVKRFPDQRIPDLVPGSVSELTRKWSGTGGVPLRVTAHVVAESPTARAEANASQVVVPWLLLALLMLLIVGAVWFWRRRARAEPAAS